MVLGSSSPGPLSFDSTSRILKIRESYNNDHCIWKGVISTNDNDNKGITDALYVVSGVLSVICIVTLQIFKWKLNLRKLTYSKSYENFYVFLTAVMLRLIVPKICHFIIPFAEPEYFNCEVCGYAENFFTLLEIETLTLVCIERFVLLKYIYNGWEMDMSHYKLFNALAGGFSFLYSAPPIFGFGKFSKDFDCVQCSFDMILRQDWQRYLVLGIWVLRSIKPVIFMIVMLSKAIKIHKKLDVELLKMSDILFTNMVKSVVVVNLTCWLPMALTRGSVLFSQIAFDEIYRPPGIVVHLAEIFYEMSPIATTLVILNANKGADTKDLPVFEKSKLDAVVDEKFE